jgi:hypothetical protein
MPWVVPAANHAVGDTGHTGDHNSMAADLALVGSVLPVVLGGLGGAVAAARFVGGTASGAPASGGPFAAGDFVVDQSGNMWICTAPGSPGTWVLAGTGGGGTMINPMTSAGDMIKAGSGGSPQRLPAGSSGQALVISGGVPGWGAVGVAGGGTGSALGTGLSAWLNVVTGYSADPTGAADSTSAWTSAITAARTLGVPVYGPAGKYKTTSTIDYTGVTIIGDGSWPSPDQDSGTVFVPTSAVTGSVLQNSCPNTAATQTAGGQLYGIGIDGTALTGAVPVIYAVGKVLHGVIEGVSVYGGSGNAIDVSSANSNASGTPYGWHVRRVKIDSPGGYGVSCGGHTDGIWSDVHVINPVQHCWYISGAPSNSRFIGCRGEWAQSGYYGLYLTGAWNNGTGSGGCVFTAFSTDRNDQDGIHIDATGNEPVIFEGLMLRRDGRNGGSGGGSYAGLNLNGATIPVIIGSVSVFPGVDDTGSGTNSPQYGLSVTSTSYLEITAGYIHGATNAVHQGSGNSVVNIGPNVFTASGTTGSPTVNTTPYFATMNAASLFLQKAASNVATLSVTNTTSAPTNPTTQLYGAAAGDKMLAGAVTGDTSSRWLVDTNGKQSWGAGSGGQDATLSRAAAGVLQAANALGVAGLAGATAATRFAGGTSSGAPVSGTFAAGDFVIDQTGHIYVCTTAGTPGTWANAGSSSGVSTFNSRSGAVTPGAADYLAVATGGLAGATAAVRFVGGTVSAAPASGTFATGDFVVTQSGLIFICTAGGTPGTWSSGYALLSGATMTGYLAPAVVALTFVGSGTTLVNAALGNDFRLTVTASTTTIGNPSNSVDGQRIDFTITQGSGGSFTVAWAGNYDFGAAGTPTLSTAAGAVDIIGFVYNAAKGKWLALGAAFGF